jgi:uncharacterized membrane protein YgcG
MLDDKSSQPSLFELYFLESIMDLLKPAIRHVLFALTTAMTNTSATVSSESSVLSTASLSVALFTQTHFDDLFFLIELAADSMSLFGNRAGQFVERLYSLERVSSVHTDGGTKITDLTVAQRLWSLILFVLLPRVSSSLKELAQLLQQQQQQHPEGIQAADPPQGTFAAFLHSLQQSLQTLASQCLQTLVRLMPYVQIGSQMVLLAFRILYVLGLTPYHHPFFALMQMKLMKSRHVDQTITASHTRSPLSASSNLPLKMIFTSIFALRGVDWFMNQDFSEDHVSTRLASSAQSSTSHHPSSRSELISSKIPFPKPPKAAVGGIQPLISPSPVNSSEDVAESSSSSSCGNGNSGSSSSSNTSNNGGEGGGEGGRAKSSASVLLCPLCQQQRRHATAAPSGYVFCFRCISSYVQEKKRCPITFLPCDLLDLIRLYENVPSSSSSSSASASASASASTSTSTLTETRPVSTSTAAPATSI